MNWWITFTAGPLYGTRPSTPSGTSLSASAPSWKVTVARTFAHGAERTHATVGLVRTALINLDLAGRLVGPGQQAADHHAVRAGGERLDDIAGVTDATVGDNADVAALERGGDVTDGRELRHAHARDHARGADRARADANLYGIGAGFLSARAASPVAILPPITAMPG